QRCFLGSLAGEPGFAISNRAMDNAVLTGRAFALLETLEFGHCGQDREACSVLQSKMPDPARLGGLESEPGLDKTLKFTRVLADLEIERVDRRNRRLEHSGDGIATLDGADVPGQSDEIAPVAFLAEEGRGTCGVAGDERRIEFLNPGRANSGRC